MKIRYWLCASGLVFGLASGQAHADRIYGVSGCGLGSLLFEPKSGASSQSLAAYSNYLLYNQMFAISFGTSNCVPSGKGTALDEQQQEAFFVANFSTLSKEIARGEGETVLALAGTLGCEPKLADAVAGELQAGYDTIFAQPGAVAAFDAACDTLRADPIVSAGCAKL